MKNSIKKIIDGYDRKLNPHSTTVVMPFEYDIADEMKSLVTIENNTMNFRCTWDIGKLVGLYSAYKNLVEHIKNK